MDSDSILDLAILDSYRALQDDGQPDVVTEFIDIFLEDAPARMDRLRRAVATGDLAELRSAAHALKGSSGSVGAVQVAAVCSQIESNARAGSTAGSVELLTKVETEIARATEELKKLRKP